MTDREKLQEIENFIKSDICESCIAWQQMDDCDINCDECNIQIIKDILEK